MWIEMVRNTLVEGVARSVGETLEVEDLLGEALVFMKKARLVRQAHQPAQPTQAHQPVGLASTSSASEVAVVAADEAAVVVAAERAILEPLEVAETSRKRRKSA